MAEHAAHHAAHDAADEGAGVATTTTTPTTTTTAAAAAIVTAAATTATAAVARVGIVAGGLGRGDDLNEQRLMLELVQIAADGIATGGLPALDHRAGIFVELAGHLGVEAKTVQPPLPVLALALFQYDLVLGHLGGFVSEGGGMAGSGQVAGRGRGTGSDRR